MVSKEECQCCDACPGFKKIIKIKDTGLTLYRYSSPLKDVTDGVEQPDVSDKPDNACSNVFIIHNTTSSVVSKNKYISEFVQQYSIKCPRCKYIFEHAMKLLGRKTHVKEFEITGICQHCQAEGNKFRPCSLCCEVVNKFIALKKQIKKEIEEYYMLKRLKDYLKYENFPFKLHRSVSELHIKDKYDTRSSSCVQKPQLDHFNFNDLNKLSPICTTSHRIPDINVKSKENIKFASNLNIKHVTSDTLIGNSKAGILRQKTPRQYLQSELNALDLENIIRDDLFYRKKNNADNICKDFSFVFIKKTVGDPNIPKKDVSSSELIRDTQKMLLEREKNKVKKMDQNILENQGKKYLEHKKKKSSKRSSKQMSEDKFLIHNIEAQKNLPEEAEKLSLKKPIQNNTLFKKLKQDKKNEKHSNKSFQNQMETKSQRTEKLDTKRNYSKENRLKSDKKNTILEISGKLPIVEQNKRTGDKLNEKKYQEKKDLVKKGNIESIGDKAKVRLTSDNETKLSARPESKRKEVEQAEANLHTEIKVKDVVIRKPSTDDLILQLVKLKQSDANKPRKRPQRLSETKVSPRQITAHKNHKFKKIPNCIICDDSELELDLENIIMKKRDSSDVSDVIIGEKLMKRKINVLQENEKVSMVPKIFMSTWEDDELKFNLQETKGGGDHKVPIAKGEQEIPKGVIRYALSDRTFIDKGWTMLPTEKVVRKMNVYRMRPAHPEFDWFEHNKDKKIINYNSGEKLAEFDDNGKGRWFYRNGKLALDYYDAEEINAKQRFVIYSSGEPDERGHSRPLVILATFDYLGNGVVFDHTGKIRLKYNQTEGIVLDRTIGPVSHWKWHTLNDPPVLQQVMIDTQMAHKDPDIFKLGGPAEEKTKADNEEMLAIEFDNFIKEKSKKLSQKFKPFQIKMKALKINEHFSLKVLDQATVYLIFRDGSTNLKINIGMILDHQEIVDTDTAEVGEVSNSLERFPARTDSLAGLQKSIAYAQRVERARVERERRFRPVKLCASIDKLNAAVSRPLRQPFRTMTCTDVETSNDFKCQCRKPASCNLYYDTRFP